MKSSVSVIDLNRLILFCLLVVGFVKCKPSTDTLFKLLPSEDTGVDFVNTITETDSFNILTEEYIYNGAGVAIADFNSDGLQDIFFSANEGSNKLYLNTGEMRFEDVTDKAQINKTGRWNSGVVVVDINNDGLQDIYVCGTMKRDPVDRANMLFVNTGIADGKVPVFKEVASEYGIADTGYSTMAGFFDYDRDGDLDLYVLTNEQLKNLPGNYRPKITDGSSPNNDRLYRNNGDGTFTDVTKEAGILYEGFGLGLAFSDFNSDGWTDIYVSNDFLSADILYINNTNGSFTNVTEKWIAHQSHSSMGNDVADINNDALPDIVTLDMLPETNFRKKTTINNKSYQTYINNDKFKYEYQYVRNMLHLNNGIGQQVPFSEIGQLSGIHQTEWSWSPLFMDIDNDGLKDLLVTNGFPKDITDKDFSNYRSKVGAYLGIKDLVDSIPVVKIPNYAFRNNGDLTFRDVTKTWGFDTPSFSNGAAYADLDNDGDLDYIVNNINDKAFIYENTLYTKEKERTTHYIRCKLSGPPLNKQAIGAKVALYYDSGKTQYFESQVARGYLSSVENIIHAGLGDATMVDSILVQWPDGKNQKLQNIKADQVVVIEYNPEPSQRKSVSPSFEKGLLVKEVSADIKLTFTHQEDDKIDFNLQRTLPHKFTQSGPGVSVGDVNGDSYDDVVLGGSSRFATTVFIQKPDGTFLPSQSLQDGPKPEEDQGILLFDADGDNDQDLYIVSGSIEYEPGSKIYRDKLYLNNGKGKFRLDSMALPDIASNGSCIRAADIDKDGDLDLFVGGRVVPAAYPNADQSYILRNDKGKFTNVTNEISPALTGVGMVADALFTDFDNDGSIDLVVAGEFMPVTFFQNTNGRFEKIVSGIDEHVGWWNSIAGGDFDNDGDIDYVAGNLGLNNCYQANSKHPLKLYAKDFDANGSVDPVLACYMRTSMDSEERQLFPIHFWDELNSQSPKFRQQFSRYKQYGRTTMDSLFKKTDLNGAVILEANHFETSYIENLGNGKFSIRPLPILSQVAPVNGMIVDDIDEDGNLDVMMIGNDYGNEVFYGRYDAFTGLVLKGDGKGGFTAKRSMETGFLVNGDAKALARVYRSNGDLLYLATRNRGSLKLHEKISTQKKTQASIALNSLDSWAKVRYNDNSESRVEFYYGCGYLSQSSRRFSIPNHAKEVTIYSFDGQSRKLQMNGSSISQRK